MTTATQGTAYLLGNDIGRARTPQDFGHVLETVKSITPDFARKFVEPEYNRFTLGINNPEAINCLVQGNAVSIGTLALILAPDKQDGVESPGLDTLFKAFLSGIKDSGYSLRGARAEVSASFTHFATKLLALNSIDTYDLVSDLVAEGRQAGLISMRDRLDLSTELAIKSLRRRIRAGRQAAKLTLDTITATHDDRHEPVILHVER